MSPNRSPSPLFLITALTWQAANQKDLSTWQAANQKDLSTWQAANQKDLSTWQAANQKDLSCTNGNSSGSRGMIDFLIPVFY
ncbi:hypothetical protein KUCAC02_031601 [Chaenocephalus aceratus]|nr:hypothetical protein KUCAC02_031601 [Chaenocephalus aceratus]